MMWSKIKPGTVECYQRVATAMTREPTIWNNVDATVHGNYQQNDCRYSLTSDEITPSGSDCLRTSKLLLVARCCGDSSWRVTFTPVKSPLQRRRAFSSRFCCCSSVQSTGPKSAALRRNGWSRRRPPGPSAGLRKSALNNHSEKISRARRRRWADGEFDDRSSRSSRSCTNNLLLAEPVHCNDSSSEKPASPTDSCHGRVGPRDGGVNTGLEMLKERGGIPPVLCASELARSVPHIDDAAFHNAENIMLPSIGLLHSNITGNYSCQQIHHATTSTCYKISFFCKKTSNAQQSHYNSGMFTKQTITSDCRYCPVVWLP